MNPLTKRSIASLGVLTALAAILVLFAVLQYRWSGEVSEAERARMWESLNTSLNQFRGDFYSELAPVCAAFQIDPMASSDISGGSYAQRYQDWSRRAGHPQLIADVYLWYAGRGEPSQLLVLDRTSRRFEPVGWPRELEELRGRLGEQEMQGRRHPPGPEGRRFAWILEERIPALINPIFQSAPRPGDSTPSSPHLAGHVILELNMKFLQSELFPDLTNRHFGGPGGLLYEVAVVRRGEPENIIYQSDPRQPIKPLSSADAVVGLLRGRLERHLALSLESETILVPGNEAPRSAGTGVEGWHDPWWQIRRRLPTILVPPDEAGEWQLVVRHRSGSLQAAVATFHHRNLAMSFGVLLLLAVGMAMVFVSTERARRLATLQMEFVAGVSHELRTPLAVISSAADNLVAGIVHTEQHVHQYGTLIGNEARRLAAMVQQILLFASGEASPARYEVRPVEIAQIIDRALSESGGMLEEAGFRVEKQIQSGLPMAVADASGLTQCLENLLSNAVKYRRDQRWLAIRAQLGRGVRGPEVEVTVEDKGMGIESEDLPHIFDPFYRGRAVQAAQIHGTGLGLCLAKRVTEAMGGRLSVTSVAGKGSAFTLHLPALEDGKAPRGNTDQ